MSQLTVCLVTRGREDFLDSSLQSLEFIKTQHLANVLIVDNGSNEITSIKLKEWASLNSCEFVRFDANDSRLNRVWEILKSKEVEWVLFPGDDDIVIPESIVDVLKIIQEHPNLNAVSFDVREMDIHGKVSKGNRRPAFKENASSQQQVASVFNEPAFLWPSLFINVKAIPDVVPTSRYVFDWWVGIQLLLKGNVKSVNQAAVQYRRHSSQESNLADLRRKYFEASYWITELVQSGEFASWIDSQSEKQIHEFWDQIMATKPIYGDSQYGFPVQLLIGKQIIENLKFKHLRNVIALDLATSQSVMFKRGEAGNILPWEGDIPNKSFSNVGIEFDPGVCALVASAKTYFNSTSKSIAARVSCLHSARQDEGLLVTCTELRGLTSDQIADLILSMRTKEIENLGLGRQILTPNERLLVQFFRKSQGRVPSIFKIIAKYVLGIHRGRLTK